MCLIDNVTSLSVSVKIIQHEIHSFLIISISSYEGFFPFISYIFNRINILPNLFISQLLVNWNLNLKISRRYICKRRIV